MTSSCEIVSSPRLLTNSLPDLSVCMWSSVEIYHGHEAEIEQTGKIRKPERTTLCAKYAQFRLLAFAGVFNAAPSA